jgi:hypothetical protein
MKGVDSNDCHGNLQVVTVNIWLVMWVGLSRASGEPNKIILIGGYACALSTLHFFNPTPAGRKSTHFPAFCALPAAWA